MTDPHNQNNDPIEALVSDLKPVKPVKVKFLAVLGLLGLLGFAAYVLVFYQARREIDQGVMSTILANPMIWLKPLYFLVLGLLGLTGIGLLSRPEGTIKGSLLIGFMALFALMFLAGGLVLAIQGPKEFAHQLSQPFIVSVSTIFGGGVIFLLVLRAFWLRRTASQWPQALGAISGLTSACLMSAAYALHCPQDSPLYLSLFYMGPVLALSILGAWLGRRELKW
jgi:hypothetical protein